MKNAAKLIGAYWVGFKMGAGTIILIELAILGGLWYYGLI